MAQSVGTNVSGVVHCGRGNADAITSEKTTAMIHNQRRRLSRKSESMDSELSIVAESENDIVSFNADDKLFIVKDGTVEGEVTVREIAEAIEARKDNDEMTAEMFAKIASGRRRSSVLRDKQLEAAAVELGDRMI